MDDRVGVAVAVVVVAMLLVGTSPVAATAPQARAQAQIQEPSVEYAHSTADSEAFAQDRIDADEVHMNVAIRADGTAEWTLEFWVRLDDDEQAAAFDDLQADIRNDPENYTRTFADRMRGTVATASDATGREMSADGFTVETERRSFAREYGVVRYAFRWHGFAAVDGNELRAGDAVEGLFLDDGTRLLLEWPAEYELQSASPAPDERRENAVLWRGSETDFVSGEPTITVTGGGLGPGFDRATLAALAALAVGSAAGAWRYRKRLRRRVRSAIGSDPESAPGRASAAETTEASADSSTTAATDATGAGDNPQSDPVSDADSDADSASAPTADPEPAPDPELLSNEEQVLRLVRERGGRAKQQTVVEELGWTDAKTSKVVSGLREDGELESFRLGRENVLSLPDEDDETEAATPNGGGESP